MKAKIIILLMVIACGHHFHANAAYDSCLTAKTIPNVISYCSAAGEFTNVGARVSEFNNISSCWSSGAGVNNDVWFKFVAVATATYIKVYGNVNGNGTMQRPEAELFISSGNPCSVMNSRLICQSGVTTGKDSVVLFDGALIPGQTYWLRIGSLVPGTFKLCIDNFNPPVQPGQDCPTAVKLCDKSPIFNTTLKGPGSDNNEGANTCLNDDGSTFEENTSWYTWIAADTGSITFTISPNVSTDDLDFALFEFSTHNDCNTKTKIRCAAAGGPLGSPCNGATGLNMTSTDLDEKPGCTGGNNRFVKFLKQETGKMYGLLIDNFSANNGYSITWGGTGHFRGPLADFTSSENDTICGTGIPITLTNTSQFTDSIRWQFSPGGNITTSTSSNPTIIYNTPGTYTVAIQVYGLYCNDAKTITYTIADPKISSISKTDINCSSLGTATSNVIGGTSYNYSWSTLPVQTTATATGLNVGNYTVQVTDVPSGCSASSSITITQGLPLSVTVSNDTSICEGRTVSIGGITTHGKEPYQYNWSPAIGTGGGPHSITPTATTTYTLITTDACGVTIASTIQVIVKPSSKADFAISDTVANSGAPIIFTDSSKNTTNWTWDFGDGISSNQSSPTHSYMAAGKYRVVLITTNDNGCPDTLAREIRIKKLIEVPNIFSPTGDNINDIFLVTTSSVKEYQIDIYDRWGLKMFSSDNPQKHWDGKTPNDLNASDGTYYFILKATFYDGEVVEKHGWLTLVR